MYKLQTQLEEKNIWYLRVCIKPKMPSDPSNFVVTAFISLLGINYQNHLFVAGG